MLLLLYLFLTPSFIYSQSQLKYNSSWIGNTFGAQAVSYNRKHVQLSVETIFVNPTSGNIYSNSVWDEDGYESGIYNNADVKGACGDIHGWGRDGGHAVTSTSDDRKVILGILQGGCDGGDYPNTNTNGLLKFPPCHYNWYCIRVYSWDGNLCTPIAFPTGYGYDDSLLIINNVSETIDASIGGVATNDNKIWVSDPYNNQILIFDVTTLKQLGNWTVTRPSQIALDENSNLWVLQKGDSSNPYKILNFDTNGKLLSSSITFPSNIVPTNLAYDKVGKRLLVTDDGVAQQIRIYGNLNDTTPTLLSTFGTPGGIYAGNTNEIGKTGPLRFNQLTGVGLTSNGNIIVASDGSCCGGGTVLESYNLTSSNLNWQLLGIEFVDGADIDSTSNGTAVYTKEEYFKIDLSNPTPGEQFTYIAYTTHRFKYPQDARYHLSPTSPFVRNLNNRIYLYLIDMYSSYLAVYRFNASTDGYIAIPSGLITKQHIDDTTWPPYQPATGLEWIWRDNNGNGEFDSNEYLTSNSSQSTNGWGWWIDSRGTIWQCGGDSNNGGIRYWPLQNVDSFNNPIYTYTSAVVTALPSDVTWTEIDRIIYFPENDILYLSGFTTEYPNNLGWWGMVGHVVQKYENWSQGNRKASLKIPLPSDNSTNPPIGIKAMCIVDDYIFAVDSRYAHVYVLSNKDGSMIGYIAPDANVGGVSGWVDTPYGINGIKLENGEYVIYVEEDWDARILMYRWTP